MLDSIQSREINANEQTLDNYIYFSSATVNVLRGSSSVTVEVICSNIISNTITVDFATMDGTAIALSDYCPAIGTLIFTPTLELYTTKNITIQLNTIYSSTIDENFFIRLSNSLGATITEPSAITVNIINSIIPNKIPGTLPLAMPSKEIQILPLSLPR